MTEQPTPTVRAPEPEAPLPPEAELAIALSHYELGVIEQIRRIPLGHPASTKHVLRCAHGVFLLKRRKENRREFARVRFTQRVHAHLTDAGFPAPALVGSRRSGKPIVAVAEHLYELVRWEPGERFNGSAQQTQGAGAALAQCHRVLQSIGPLGEHEGPARLAGPHASPTVIGHLASIEHDLPEAAEAARKLTAAYSQAALRADEAGLGRWPEQVIHADWHPGNLHFSGHHVSAVVDFDNARLAPRVMDVAQGALQFSLTREGADPADWPVELDKDRFVHFCRAYESQLPDPLSSAEVGTLPWLMLETLIAEATGPIAATGRFAGIPGDAFLAMVWGKSRWIRDHAEDLVRAMG